MLSDAKRQGNAEHLARLKAKGCKKVTVWLSPEAQEAVGSIKEAHGSFNAGLEALTTRKPPSAS